MRLQAFGHVISVPDASLDVTSPSSMTRLRHHPRRLQPPERGVVVEFDDDRLIGLTRGDEGDHTIVAIRSFLADTTVAIDANAHADHYDDGV